MSDYSQTSCGWYSQLPHDATGLIEAVEYELKGAGAGYHNYQIRYDAARRDASLRVDGSQHADGLGNP